MLLENSYVKCVISYSFSLSLLEYRFIVKGKKNSLFRPKCIPISLDT